MKSRRLTPYRAASATPRSRPKPQSTWRAFALTLAATVGLAAAGPPAQAQAFTVLYSFAGYPTDGAGPIAGLFMDAAGNLYGTTTFGGNVNGDHCGSSGYIGCGTVFKLDVKGKETVLHNFNGPDGANPSSSLIMDAKGDLYGTTEYGGILQDCTVTGGAGCGVVFKLSGKTETVLHRFCSVEDCADGALPWRGLVMDTSGALYGTTYTGGSVNGGVVFKLVGKKETILHNFTGYSDGAYPTAGLIMDAKEHLYGTATVGGDVNCGCGVVFKLAGKKMTVLHAFKGSPDGGTPYGGLFMDPNGNLYGTTVFGGVGYDSGTVFKVSRRDKESVLFTFNSDAGGYRPQNGLVRDAEGNLYGTTQIGGDAGYGVVFEITRYGKEKVLHSFCSGDCSDGAYPWGDLIIDATGNLYGTTSGGGVNGNGTIYKITLHSPNAP